MPDKELQAALETLLSCGHALDNMLGIEVQPASVLVDLSPWPPWPEAEEVDTRT